MREKQVMNQRLRGVHLVCLALWGVVTLMMTAALANAVSVPPRDNVTSAAVHTVTE